MFCALCSAYLHGLVAYSTHLLVTSLAPTYFLAYNNAHESLPTLCCLPKTRSKSRGRRLFFFFSLLMFSLTLPLVGALAAAIIAGVGAGIFLRETLLKRRFEANLQRSSQQAKDAIADAMRRAKDAEAEGQRRAKDVLAEAERDAKEKLRDAQKAQEAALEKERGLEERTRDLDRAENECVTREKQLSEEHSRLEELLEKEGKELEKIAGFTQDEAEQKMFSLLEQKHDAALATRMKKMEQKSPKRWKTRPKMP